MDRFLTIVNVQVKHYAFCDVFSTDPSRSESSCEQGRANMTGLGHCQLYSFSSVSTRADMNPQIGDTLKCDTKRNDTFRKDRLISPSPLCLWSLISTKITAVKTISHLLLQGLNAFQVVKIGYTLCDFKESCVYK